MSLAGCALIRACRLRRDPGYGSQLGLSRYIKVTTAEKLAPPSSPRNAPARRYATTRGAPAITRARAEARCGRSAIDITRIVGEAQAGVALRAGAVREEAFVGERRRSGLVRCRTGAGARCAQAR